MGTQSFKERVKNEVIKNAKLYNKKCIFLLRIKKHNALSIIHIVNMHCL